MTLIFLAACASESLPAVKKTRLPTKQFFEPRFFEFSNRLIFSLKKHSENNPAQNGGDKYHWGPTAGGPTPAACSPSLLVNIHASIVINDLVKIRYHTFLVTNGD